MNAYVQSLLGILLSAILTENYILVKFYGICPGQRIPVDSF